MILTKHQYNEIQKEAVNKAIVYTKQTGQITSPYPYLYELLSVYDNVKFAEGIAQSVTFDNGEVFIPSISMKQMERLASEVGENRVLLNGLSGDFIPTNFSCMTLQTEVPDSMDYETHISIRKVQEKVGGNLNEYLAGKINYTQAQLCKALGAEQIEAAALAIYNIEEKGQGIIVGDQTGIGKGRTAATVLKYAIEQGKTPIFVTQSPNLFSDIYRDFFNIGADDALPIDHPNWSDFKNPVYKRIRPFIINAKAKETHIQDQNGNIIYQALDLPKQMAILKSGKLPPEYDIVLFTYPQINSEKRDVKRKFTLNAAKNSIMVLDESHTAGGASNPKNDSGLSNTGDHILNMINESAGCMFLSATFAKKAANMPIYAAKTCISDAGLDNAGMVDAFARGGVALQEVVASQLVGEGQMIRRQRNFDDIQVKYIDLEDKEAEHRAISDNITGIVRDMIKFQADYVFDTVAGMDNLLKEENAEVQTTKGTNEAGITNSPYFSRVFNIINQLLFSIKAASVADQAIKRLKEGYSVVIALANTMESFLKDYINEDGQKITEEDVINVDFTNVLMRGLRSIMSITIKDAWGKKEKRPLDVSELSQQGQAAYFSLIERIKANSSGITVSPIDVLHKKIEDAGFRILEVTGRDQQVNFIDPNKNKKHNLNGLGNPDSVDSATFLSKYKGVVFVKSQPVSGLGAISPDEIKSYPTKIKIEGEAQKEGFVLVTSPSDPTYRATSKLTAYSNTTFHNSTLKMVRKSAV